MARVEIELVGIDRATGVLHSVGGVAQGIFQGIGQAAANLMGTAVSGAFDLIKDSMIGGNAEFERYETQFGVLLGSADAAKERLAALAEFGAKTPFELPQVVRADKILQAFGLHAEDVAERFGFSGEEIRTIAGDVAAGTGASFEEISTYLGKFASGATGEAISRMQELGIVTRQQLSDMGLEFSNSGQLLTPVDDAMDVLLGAMKDKFGGMMDAQSSTFEGMMSNFEDFKAGLFRTIGEPIFDVAKRGLGKILEFFNSETAQTAIKTFAEALGEIVERVSMLFEVAMSGGNPFAIFEDGSSYIGALAEAFGATEEQGMVFAEIIKTITDAVSQAWSALQQIDLGPLMEAFGTLFATATADAPSMQEIVTGVMDAIVLAIQGLVDFINDPLLPAFTAAVNWVTEHWPEIQATIETVMTAIGTAIQTAVDVINEIWSVFAPAFAGDWEQFGRNLREKWDALWDAIKKIDWNKIGEDVLKGIAQGIEAGAIWAINAIRSVADAIMRTLTGFFESHSPSIKMSDFGKDLMKGWAGGITGGAAGPVGAMRSAASSVMSSAVTNVGGITNNYYGVQADMQYAYHRAVAGSF